MAAAAVEATNFVDEYVGAIRIKGTVGVPGDRIYFPGQIVSLKQRYSGSDTTQYYRIIKIAEDVVTLLEIDDKNDYRLKGSPRIILIRDSSGYLPLYPYYKPLKNPTSMKPSTNTNKHDKDLMLAYAPDRADEIILNYKIEYKGTTMNILGIFRSHDNQLYYLIRFDDGKHKFWRMREGGRLVRRDNAAEGASLDNTARRRPFDSARMRSLRRLADGGESLDRRVENLEARLQRIERRLDPDLPEDDETIVPDADSMPS